MLTAAAMVEDLVDGLALGADDYLPKPFDFPVLVARIGALTRRAQPAIPPLLRRGDLVLDSARIGYARRRARLELAPKEFGVLELLLASRAAACRPRSSRARVGRGGGPVHERGQDHGQPPARQARRAAADRDGRQGRIPDLSDAMGLGRRLRIRRAPCRGARSVCVWRCSTAACSSLRRRPAGDHLRRSRAHPRRLRAGVPSAGDSPRNARGAPGTAPGGLRLRRKGRSRRCR